MTVDDSKSLYESMRRAVANHGHDSRKAAFEAFLADMLGDPKHLIALAQYHFDREYPKWDHQHVGVGRSVIVPPEVRAAERATQQRNIKEEAIRIAKRVNHVVLMNLVLPSGNALRHSTFADCAKAGGWLAEVAKLGKPTEAVDKKLTEGDLRNVWNRFEKRVAA